MVAVDCVAKGGSNGAEGYGVVVVRLGDLICRGLLIVANGAAKGRIGS